MHPTRDSRTRPGAVLGVLFAGAFVMGCAEMLVVGMIDLIALDLSVSVPAAGVLVTANALGLAIGGPVLTFLTTRFDRRPVLIAATAVFVVANLLPALLPTIRCSSQHASSSAPCRGCSSRPRW